MWPAEARYRAVATVSDDSFVLSTSGGHSITVSSTDTITMVEKPTTYGELVATLTKSGKTELYRTSTGDKYYLKLDDKGLLQQISEDGKRIRNVTRLKAEDTDVNTVEDTDVGTISGVITDTTTKKGPFVCLRVDTVDGAKCKKTALFEQAQKFCEAHENDDIRGIAAKMIEPNAWTTKFGTNGEIVGPHVSLNVHHMKDLGRRIKVKMKKPAPLFNAWKDTNSYFCAIVLDSNAECDGKDFKLRNAWSGALHMSCAQYVHI